MKRLIIILATVLVAVNVNAQITWPRKYATSVIRGRVFNRPEGKDYGLSISGTSNIKQTGFPTTIQDSLGVITLKWEMCWPIILNLVKVYDVDNVIFYLFPGDTIDFEMDYEKAQKYKGNLKKLYKEAIHIKGGTFVYSPKFKAVEDKVFANSNAVDLEYFSNTPNLHFSDFRELEWERHQNRLKKIKSLKPDEREILHIRSEQIYVRRSNLYEWFLELAGRDTTARAIAKQEMAVKDPHAKELISPTTTNAVLYFDYLFYLKGNDLDDLPLGRYLKEREQANDLIAQLKSLHDIDPNDIEKLSPEFRQPLYEFREEMADKIKAATDWKPTGEQSTWLQQIVDRHKGKVVYVDYWATWCGPCQKGIKEMSKVKDEYEKRGVDFVYITDSSSSTDGYLDLKKTHSGDHFIFHKSDIGKMNIPGYGGSIPYYLIYDRNGRLITNFAGWSSVENMTRILDEALGE